MIIDIVEIHVFSFPFDIFWENKVGLVRDIHIDFVFFAYFFFNIKFKKNSNVFQILYIIVMIGRC